MTALVPPEFLFRCTYQVQRIERLPRRGKQLLKLPSECELPNTAMSRRPRFGDIRLAWNDNGLAVAVSVRGRSAPLVCNPFRPGQTDGLRLWIDTRNTQSIHRASRFCQQIEVLPAGGSDDGSAPIVTPQPIARAKEEPPAVDTELIPVYAAVIATGYDLEVWLPASVLHGFDPERQPKLGFYYAINDAELGLQTLSVGPEFPFASDPSLWSTLDLVGE